MARTRAGSDQTLSLDGTTVSGIDTAFSGITMTHTRTTHVSESGGLRTVNSGGHVTNAGTFSIGATTDSVKALWGKNGKRIEFVWTAKGVTQTFTAICIIAFNFNDRGNRSFSVTFTVDGAITTS